MGDLNDARGVVELKVAGGVAVNGKRFIQKGSGVHGVWDEYRHDIYGRLAGRQRAEQQALQRGDETHEAETNRREAGFKTHVANALICFWVYDLR